MRALLRSIGLAPYGGDELLIALVFSGATAYALNLLHPALMILPLIPLAIVIWFFRDPNRSGSDAPEILLSPADGTVSDIVEVKDSDFINGSALRIGIFLSPFNVHVNRTPYAGTVRFVKYRAGEFLPAYNPEAPTRNESCTLGLQTDKGLRLMVKQITGILARRIICEAADGDTFARGQRYGMIKFGSRTELYVPLAAGVTPLVTIGDKVVGGKTPLCSIAVFAPILEPVVPVLEGSAALPVGVEETVAAAAEPLKTIG